MKIVPVPVRSDNYAYILIDDSNSTPNAVAVVDPYDVGKIEDALKQQGVKDPVKSMLAVFTTHHHDDHAGGNEEFVSITDLSYKVDMSPACRAYAPGFQLPLLL